MAKMVSVEKIADHIRPMIIMSPFPVKDDQPWSGQVKKEINPKNVRSVLPMLEAQINQQPRTATKSVKIREAMIRDIWNCSGKSAGTIPKRRMAPQAE